MTAAGPPILPAFVAASATGPDRVRTLVLRQDAGTLSYTILRAADPVPGEPELAETAASRNAMENVVASLPAAGSGDAGDTGRALSQFGIGYVLLADPADQALAGQLNTAAGLQPLTRSSSYDLWQVSGTVARARVVTPSGTAVPVPSGSVGVNATLAPGTSGTVVLAEAAGGWSATLDGKPLTALAAPVNGWAQGFTLPAGGGHLVITRNETARNLSLGAEAAALLLVLVLALPGSRSSVPVPAAQAAADTEAVPAAGRRRARAAADTTGGDTTGGDTASGDRQDRAEGTRSARRKRRPLPALAGVTAARAMGAKEQSGARDQDSDETGAGYPLAARAATADPFGTDDDPGYGAEAGYGADAGYEADPGYAVATQGFAPRPGRQAPARTPEPALGVTPHLDEDPAPWEGLAPQIPQTPALQDRPAPEPPARRRPRPRRRGAAAVRTPPGTASRRGARGVTADARRPPGARRGRPGRARCHRRRRPARPPRDGAAPRDLGPATGPASSPAATRQVPVTSAARACPPAPGGGAAPVALLAGGSSAAGPAAGSSTAGSSTAGHGPTDQVELTALPPVGLPVRAAGPVRAQSPGALALLTLPAAKATGKQAAGQQATGQQATQPVQGWSVAGGGAMAQGLEAELTQDSGLASVRCAEPGSDLWFLGPGQQNGGSQVQLDLMNVDSTAASVDVSIINDGGQVEAGNDNGITVPPHQTVTESLSSVARGSGVLAIEVHTSIGRVAADVSAESHGVTSWLPGTAAPSTRLVIPGVPPSGSTAGLFLADPGPSTAKVTVTAITPQGHISPFGSQSVDLPGQSASYVALSPLGGTTAALQITSDVPVTGAVVVPGSSGPGVLTAATAPISEQADRGGQHQRRGHGRLGPAVRPGRRGPGQADRDRPRQPGRRQRDQQQRHGQPGGVGQGRPYAGRAGQGPQRRQTRFGLRPRDHAAARLRAALRRPGGDPGPQQRGLHHPGRQRAEHDQPATGPRLLRRDLAALNRPSEPAQPVQPRSP